MIAHSASNQSTLGARARLDRVLSRYCELTVLGQHLQRRTVKPDPAYFTPHCTIEVDRGPAPLIHSAPLESSVSAEGVP